MAANLSSRNIVPVGNIIRRILDNCAFTLSAMLWSIDQRAVSRCLSRVGSEPGVGQPQRLGGNKRLLIPAAGAAEPMYSGSALTR